MLGIRAVSILTEFSLPPNSRSALHGYVMGSAFSRLLLFIFLIVRKEVQTTIQKTNRKACPVSPSWLCPVLTFHMPLFLGLHISPDYESNLTFILEVAQALEWPATRRVSIRGACRVTASVSWFSQPHTSEKASHCLSFDSSLPELAEFAKVGGLIGGLCAYYVIGKVLGSLSADWNRLPVRHLQGTKGSSLQPSSLPSLLYSPSPHLWM